MGWYSSVLIVSLVFAVLFSSLYSASQLSIPRHPPNIIRTQPKISQLQAIEVAERHLLSEIPHLQEVRLYFYLYNFTDERYASDPQYQDYIHTVARGGWPFSHVKDNPELLNLPLIFVHANGTQYQVNSTDGSYQMRCLQAPDLASCVLPFHAANAARDRLVYRTETRWQPSTEEVPYNEGFHIIDAETGELVWNSIEWEHNRKPIPPNMDYEGHKTVKDRLNERLNPPEFTQVFIAEGASLASLRTSSEQENTERFFVPKEARAVETLSNRVVWTNNDMTAHIVASDDGYSNPYTGTFKSGFIQPDESYEYVFIEVGEYPYHCDVHPWMQGKVVIVENFA